MKVGIWYYSLDHAQLGQVIDTQTIWGETICLVWLPGKDAVVRVPASRLRPASEAGLQSVNDILFLTAAARVADALTHDVLLAPIESSVIPLPHQVRALARATSGQRVRYLLADEVGLGKTIEAGLIMRELKLRGLIKRILVVAPKGLVTQWVAEMRTHFDEDFRLLIPGDFAAYRRIVHEDNIWLTHHQVVCPMDSVKPMTARRGWSEEQVAAYNKERFEDLISARWDLIIVDEAHRLGGSTDRVARYKLGQGLAQAAPYLLLLSATPHQGKTEQFHRLMSLLDQRAFPDVSSITRDRVQPYVIRTEKRRAIDAQGKPLFKPRITELIPVPWSSRHREHRLLYDAVTEYVREGYNQAMRENRHHIGFLMVLMLRLVASSTQAIAATLERRLDVLNEPDQQLSLFPVITDEEWYDLDGESQLMALLQTRLSAMQNERDEVQLLLDLAARCQRQAPDPKAEALLEWIYRLQSEESDPDLKVLIFTEFVQTQQMLFDFLTERGFSVVRINGSMDMEERQRAQDAFAKEARILISTDAGGEGLNLQFCHVVINYDIPWNPMRLEQRIGRVDRIGQTHPVRAINFVLEDSVEHRVREVLEEKLTVIFQDFGIDKTGDVLDSAQAGEIFDDLFVDAILHPEQVEEKVDEVVHALHEQAQQVKENASVLGAAEDLDPAEVQRLLAHPLPHWVERMTVSYLRSHGGDAQRRGRAWQLTWPDDETMPNVVFSIKEAERDPTARHLTLEESRIRGLTSRFPLFIPAQPIPRISLSGLGWDIQGFWSLWRVAITTPDWNRQRMMPLFLASNGRVFIPTARFIWDQFMTATPQVLGYLSPDEAGDAYSRLRQAAEKHGKPLFDELLRTHQQMLQQEREKAAYAFEARRKAIERVGLPQVRAHRLQRLAQEEQDFWAELARREQILPELTPLIVLFVQGADHV